MAREWVGRVLAGKYRVDRVVGDGGMGIVVAATHLELDEEVAIKLLHVEAGRDVDVIARFLREGKIAARLKSEHIVRVRDVGRLDDGTPFMVMELLVGRDLAAVVGEGPLPIPFAIDCVLQACDAISEAHGRGIVHRDLKPANLFLTRRRDGSPSVKVLDFGISKLQAGDSELGRTSTKAVFGSPLYMSPEQLASSADVDGRADVWALAMVLFELLTGRTAFEENTLAMLHVAILREPAPDVRSLRPDVPEPVARAIAAALVKRREERTATIAELAAALVPFASPVGAQAFRMISVAHPVSDRAISVGAAPSTRAPVDPAAIPGKTMTQGAFATNAPIAPGSRRTLAVVGFSFALLALVGGAAIAVGLARSSGSASATAPAGAVSSTTSPGEAVSASAPTEAMSASAPAEAVSAAASPGPSAAASPSPALSNSPEVPAIAKSAELAPVPSPHVRGSPRGVKPSSRPPVTRAAGGADANRRTLPPDR